MQVFRKYTTLLLVASLATLSFSQKKPLDPSAWDGWKSITGSQLSRTGKWVTYAINPQVGDGELTVRSTENTTAYNIPRGQAARFSNDERFVTFTIVPAKADVDKARAEKKAPKDQPKNVFVIMDLSNGQMTRIEKVQGQRFAEEDSGWFAYQLESEAATPGARPGGAGGGRPSAGPGTAGGPASGAATGAVAGGAAGQQPPQANEPKAEAKKEPVKKSNHAVGSELIIRKYATGEEVKLADVASYQWNKNGTKILYAKSTKDGKEDGVYLYDVTDGSSLTIMKMMAQYRGLTFSEDEKRIAFTSDAEDYSSERPTLGVYDWSLNRKSAGLVAKEGSPGIPKGWWIAPTSSPSYSKKGNWLFFSTAPKPAPEVKDETPAEDKVNLDLWNWKDPVLMPQQLLQANQERNRSYDAVAFLNHREVRQLETPELPNINFSRNETPWAIGVNNTPYRREASWDMGNQDLYWVNIVTGDSKLLFKKSNNNITLSPTGRYGLMFDNDKLSWNVLDMKSGEWRNISDKIGYPIHDIEHDEPSEPGSLGVGGWLKGDAGVLIYDQFDIWLCDPSGEKDPVCVTDELGRLRNWTIRNVNYNPDPEGIDPERELLLTVVDQRTMASGFYKDKIHGKLGPQRLIWGDRLHSLQTVAKEGNKVLFTQQTFKDFPNVRLTDLSFSNPVQLTDANPQQKEYLWGSSEPISWISGDGKELSGIVIKPENFDPSKKYPMIVYFYDRSFNQLHQHFSPNPSASVINRTEYASNGYVVFIPDIVYNVGYPGEGAEHAVISGTQAVLARGYVDPKRVAIQGQSWGGYQVVHLITRSNLFAAACAGAPVSNMFSAYGGIRWGSGLVRQFQYEKAQSRIGGSIWERPLQYLENSPLFWAEKIQTPLLLMNNDADGAVPWWQGIELFTAMRRLDKPVWLCVYNGEDHNLIQRKNKKDWSVRMFQFFETFLKGQPAPVWIVDGIPATMKGKTYGFEIKK